MTKLLLCCFAFLLSSVQSFDIYAMIEDVAVGYNEGMWDIKNAQCDEDIKQSVEQVKQTIHHLNFENYPALIQKAQALLSSVSALENACHSSRYSKYMFEEVMHPTTFFQVLWNYFENFTTINQLQWSMIFSLNDGIQAERLGKDMGIITRYMMGIDLEKWFIHQKLNIN